jgi:hypothetical protein
MNSLFMVMRRLHVPQPALPIKFRTIHEHASGECVGWLIVKEDTIDFTPDEGPDRFVIPLRSVRFVARGARKNWGALVAAAQAAARGVGVANYNLPTAISRGIVPLRIETPDRNYTFCAREPAVDAASTPGEEDIGQAAQLTDEMFRLLQRLYLLDSDKRKR